MKKKIAKTGGVTVRRAGAGDAAVLLRFMFCLAQHVDQVEHVTQTEDSLVRDLNKTRPPFQAWVAEIGGMPIGFLVGHLGYSAWKGKALYFLNVMWVEPEHRRVRAAHALFDTAIHYARKRGCSYLEWACMPDNEPALKFYEAVGATIEPECLMNFTL